MGLIGCYLCKNFTWSLNSIFQKHKIKHSLRQNKLSRSEAGDFPAAYFRVKADPEAPQVRGGHDHQPGRSRGHVLTTEDITARQAGPGVAHPKNKKAAGVPLFLQVNEASQAFSENFL
jgi:hypothetical protein